MKAYLFDYDLTERTPQIAYVSKYSSYKVGLKCEDTALSDISLYDGNNSISADAADFNGYKTFALSAGEGQKDYIVDVSGKKMKLTVKSTDSTVAELPIPTSSGGGSSSAVPKQVCDLTFNFKSDDTEAQFESIRTFGYVWNTDDNAIYFIYLGGTGSIDKTYIAFDSSFDISTKSIEQIVAAIPQYAIEAIGGMSIDAGSVTDLECTWVQAQKMS